MGVSEKEVGQERAPQRTRPASTSPIGNRRQKPPKHIKTLLKLKHECQKFSQKQKGVVGEGDRGQVRQDLSSHTKEPAL